MDQQGENRRDFLKAGTVVAGTVLTTSLFPSGVYAAGSDEIKVGIIGCGGRGGGAGENVLQAAKNVTIYALGDAFEDRLKGTQKHLQEFAKDDKKSQELGNKMDVSGRTYVGLDAYKQVIDSGANYIILATPPGFRPIHLEAAVAAGKNIFTEKPVAVDGPGIRKVFAAEQESKKKKLAIGAGTQRRHQSGYRALMKRIHDGDIGDIVGGRCYWNQNILWKVDRQEGWTDLTWQMRNWYNFTWLCGDHIVEQHVHNIDVINWATGEHPVKALGMGSRTRTDPRYGHIYDFFAVDFEYPRNVHVISMCRQISNCANGVNEGVQGTKGNAESCDRRYYRLNGKPIFNPDDDNAPYVQEHTDLIEAIRKNEPYNELKNVAESTLSAIMGRMSAYTGKLVTWEMALNSKQSLMPEKLEWDMKLPVPPVAVPGKTKFI